MKKITDRSTKTDILEAYNEIVTQLQEERKTDKKVLIEETEKKQKKEETASMSEDKIVKGIAELKLQLNAALDQVEDALSTERRKLSRVQDAIKYESDYLEELYGIKANTDSLAALVQAQAYEKQVFDEEINEKRTSFELEMSEKKQQWIKEQKERETAIKEQEEQLNKTRKREEEEYSYNLKLIRKKDQDIYSTKKETQEKELAEKKAAVEKDLNEREEKITNSEKELAELRNKVETFPSELAKAVEIAEKNLESKMQVQFNYEKQLTRKDMEAEIRLLKQTITSYENKINELQALNQQLTHRSDNANVQVKDIAMKAIEGASLQRYNIQIPDKKEIKEKE